MKKRDCLILSLAAAVPPLCKAQEAVKLPAMVSSLEAEELQDFAQMPPRVQKIIRTALALTKRQLTYLLASHDPERGGMDCSGSIYRVLMDEKVPQVPRQSDEMCLWTQQSGTFQRTAGVLKLDEPVFAKMQPGDLLFWARRDGEVPGRKLPVTHVMLYLGKRAKDGKPLIYGSSDGRSYDGQKRRGVSVFDFTLPKKDSVTELYGYGTIPEIKKPKTEPNPKTKTTTSKPKAKKSTLDR